MIFGEDPPPTTLENRPVTERPPLTAYVVACFDVDHEGDLAKMAASLDEAQTEERKAQTRERLGYMVSQQGTPQEDDGLLFRDDNTTGYTRSEVRSLNAEWARIVERKGLGLDSYEYANEAKAHCDRVARR